MSRVVVLGGTWAGMSAAARLAKLGHRVTLVAPEARLAPELDTVRAAGFLWPAGPERLLMPGPVRDVFRKSGRPLAAELEIGLDPVVAEHRFPDGTRVRHRGGSRGDQHDAMATLPPSGRRDPATEWLAWTDRLGAEWDGLRREFLERPWAPDYATRDVRGLLDPRPSLAKRVRRGLRDPRLRAIALHPWVAEGYAPDRLPGWMAATGWMEQRFGMWQVAGGMPALRQVLENRLAVRGVEIVTVHGEPGPADRPPPLEVVVEDGTVRGVRSVSSGLRLDCASVVCALDPWSLPSLRPYLPRRRITPTPQPVTRLGISTAHGAPEPEPLPAEVVLHERRGGFVVRTGAGLPATEDGRPDRRAWTVRRFGAPGSDPVEAVVAAGLITPEQVVHRHEEAPATAPLSSIAEGGLPIGPRTMLPGLHLVGEHAAPGPGMTLATLSSSLVAQTVGPAPA